MRLPPALRLRDFRLLIAAMLGMGLAGQMVDVAIGWQVYAIHRSALDLGLIGLADFVQLPLFARSILHSGPGGLGVLRSARSVGGLAAALLLTRYSVGRRSGRTLLLVVALFGACMVVFGLSRWFALSFAALAIAGFVDMIS